MHLSKLEQYKNCDVSGRTAKTLWFQAAPIMKMIMDVPWIFCLVLFCDDRGKGGLRHVENILYLLINCEFKESL
jgi:hypothetical protein